MPNDIATLRPRLAVALRDPDMEVWDENEMTAILEDATTQLYPRVARPIAAPIYPLDEGTEDYDLPEGVLEVSRVDVGKVADDTLLMHVPNGAWEIYGDVYSGTAQLFVNRQYASVDYYFIVHGYGTYDLVEFTPPDLYVPFILATARAEAFRGMIAKRARFEKWQALNQKENVSVNELGQMIAQAEGEAERQRARMKTWRKPKPAR